MVSSGDERAAIPGDELGEEVLAHADHLGSREPTACAIDRPGSVTVRAPLPFSEWT
jgi:hypothetical protein